MVIDPNVWIAALLNRHGTPAQIIEAVMSDQIVAVVSPHLLDELAAVLVRPKFRRWLTLADAVAFVEALGGKADVHPDPESPARCVRDPNDDYLVALAAVPGATIVTGDADLLNAELHPPAITPHDLLDRLPR